MATRKLQVEIIGDASSLQRAFGKATGSSSKLGSGLRALGKVATVGVGAAFVGMAATLRVGFDEMAEGQKVAAQTAAGLKSTGGVANVTAKEIENLAGAISRKTGIDDESVQASENMLLTFTAVRNEVGKGNDIFNQATQAVSDMATRMNNGAIPSMEQLSKNSILVGKALNDPVKGMTALRRVGVAFTKSQEDQIKAMVKAGDTMGAQKLILAELTKEFGGSAKAAGDTFPGQLAKLRNSFEEMAGSLAESLLPYLQRFLDWANQNMPTIQRIMQGAIDLIVKAIETLADAFGTLEGPLATFKGWLEDNPEKARILAGALIGLAGALAVATVAQAALNLAVLANPYVAAIAAIGLMVGALVTLYVTNQRVQQVVDENFRKIRAIVQDVIPVILGIWQRFGASFIAIGEAMFKTVTLGMRNMLDILRGIVNVFAGVFTGDWERVWKGVKQVFDGMIGNLLGVVRAWAGALLTLAKQAGAAIVSGVTSGMAGLAGAVAEKLGALLALMRSLPGRIVGALGDLSSILYNAGVQIIQGLISGITDKLGDLYGLVGGIGKRIASLKGPIEKDRKLLVRQGEAIIEGLITGMEGRLSGVDGVASGIGPRIGRAVSDIGDVGTFDTFAREAVSSFGQVAEAKDGLMENYQTFADTTQTVTDQTVGNFRNVGTEMQSLRFSSDSLWPAMTKQVLDTRKMTVGPLEDITSSFDLLSETFGHLGGNLYGLRNTARDTIPDIIDLLGSGLLGVNKLLVRGFAGGGRVRGGEPIIVGEAGPEIFLPGMNGQIVPSNVATGGSPLGGGSVINLIFNGPTVGTSREFEDTIRRALYDVQRRNPGTGLALA